MNYAVYGLSRIETSPSAPSEINAHGTPRAFISLGSLMGGLYPIHRARAGQGRARQTMPLDLAFAFPCAQRAAELMHRGAVYSI